MKTIDRLVMKARLIKNTITKLTPVVCNKDKMMDLILGYDSKYGSDMWECIFITGEDDLIDGEGVQYQSGAKLPTEPTEKKSARNRYIEKYH